MTRFVLLVTMALGVAALPVEQMTATCTPETCCFKADPKPDCDCSWATPDTCVAGNLPEGRKCGVDQCYTFCCSSQALDCCDPVDVPPQTLYCLTCPSPKDEYCDPPKEGGECDCSWIETPESCSHSDRCGVDKCYTSCCYNQEVTLDCGDYCNGNGL
mmetsp:Transcript_28183/g.72144  ORF Transcript_28183/g.72144 Transcript_28183/m.72144 type:complete len:158 (+) Transcript_28183:93-566(+)